MSSYAASSNSLGDTGLDATATVLVKNIPQTVETREIVALFRSLIGEFRFWREKKGAEGTTLEITFPQHETALKALCMKGYAIGGANLDVACISTPPIRTRRSLDDRRNLYVLGLPFALTKTEFSAIFSRYGTVVHCVILATVDNSSRRRGFVVMSSHVEAKRALAGLTRAQIKGHTIDVSWAVVQRSQGFLDGGDRAMLLDPRSSTLPGPMPGHHEPKTYSSSGSDASEFSPNPAVPDYGSIILSALPTAALLVTNLPAVLFSQTQDLHPLVCPFGHIEKIQMAPFRDSDTVSALVHYTTTEAAIEAKNALHGQAYDSSRQLEVHYTHPPFGDCAGDLGLAGAATHVNRFNYIPCYNTFRAPSPFYHYRQSQSGNASPPLASGPLRIDSRPSGRIIGQYPNHFEHEPHYGQMSRSGSPRTEFLSKQSRRLQPQGSVNPAI